MNIRLDLTHHCIQTALRRRYHAAIAGYFNSPDSKSDLEDEIDLLVQALEAFDFNRLRSQWRTLAGHRDVIVTLSHGSGSQPTLSFGSVCIIPPASPV